jgi:hypothetical protein
MISRIVCSPVSNVASHLGWQAAWQNATAPKGICPPDTPRRRACFGPCCQILNCATERPAVRPRWSSFIIHETEWKRKSVVFRDSDCFYLMCARRISSTLDCQPEPEARSASTTSGESRIETGTFVGAFCGPRLLPEIARCTATGRPDSGTARAKSLRVQSGFSRSAGISVTLFVFFRFMPGRLS